MSKSRLEAFSDGVIAIILTIMVLELKVPHGDTWADLYKIWPVFISYVLSFVYIGIYWVNHHHMFQLATLVDARILWANLHLLFWLSLVPFATAWMGENHFAQNPTVAYGGIMLASAVAYDVLLRSIRRAHGVTNMLGQQAKNNHKGSMSLVIYASGVVAAHWYPALAFGLYVLVAVMWFIPDQRIERALRHTNTHNPSSPH